MPSRRTASPLLHRKRYLALAGGLVLLDQLTKSGCRAWLLDRAPYDIVPGFFKLSLHYNTGAAFSFLAHESGWQIYLLAILALAMATWLAWSIWQGRFVGSMRLGAALILGGAIGNLMDRCYYGYVTDFLVFYYHPYYFPAFNIADTGITVGVFLWLISRSKPPFRRT